MKKRGFTLIELMGVLVLLTLIVLVAYPAIVSVVKRSNNNISKATEALIISAAKNRLEDNKNDYPLEKDRTFYQCVTNLIDSGYLIPDLQEGSSGNKLDVTNIAVKISVKNNKYVYEIVNKENCAEK